MNALKRSNISHSFNPKLLHIQIHVHVLGPSVFLLPTSYAQTAHQHFYTATRSKSSQPSEPINKDPTSSKTSPNPKMASQEPVTSKAGGWKDPMAGMTPEEIATHRRELNEMGARFYSIGYSIIGGSMGLVLLVVCYNQFMK
jgi:hypothetical protein